MLKHYSTRWAIVAMLFSVGLLIAARPARASDVQITLDNLMFDGGFGSEIFDGSFLVDTGTGEAISSSIVATGLVGLNFFGVDLTGYEPFQFAFDDGFGDVLFVNLASGLSMMSYDFSNASILPAGGLGSLEFSFENASSGSFSVSAPIAATPEPDSLLLLLTGLLVLFLVKMARRMNSARSESSRFSKKMSRI